MKSRYHALLAIWGGNVLLLALLASTWWVGAIAGVLILAAVILVFRPIALRQSGDVLAPAGTTVDSELPTLVQQVVPAWRDNIQLARVQTQEAIDRLVVRFVGIHQRLASALNLAEGKNGDIAQVLQSAAVQLGSVAAALEHVLSTRNILLQKIELLRQHNDEILHLAQDMNRHLDQQTGTDFASSQGRLSELIAVSVTSSAAITQKSRMIASQIEVALSSSKQLDTEASSMVIDSHQVIDTVIADFRQSALKLSGTVDQLEDENREVDQEVCDILVNLQFQDRISQILDHVQKDMVKLGQLLNTSAPLPAAQQWLDALAQTYTTLEQRQRHAGQQADKSMHSQVDFF